MLAAVLIALVGFARAEVVPLVHAHSHNDNERPRPLLDALEHGFCSFEADVQLVNGELRLGHESGDTKPGFTLESTYLAPLLERARVNGGRIYPGGPTVTLLIDIKTDAAPTYAALKVLLARYAELLTVYRDGTPVYGAVSVIFTGNAPRHALSAEKLAYAALDGDVDDLDGSWPAWRMPQVSEDWRFQFDWKADRPLSAKAVAKLKGFVDKAHAQHRRIRFYAAPDNELAWETFLSVGVDLINTDHLDALRDFLVRRAAASTDPAEPPVSN